MPFLSIVFSSMALLKRLQPIVISWLLVRDSSHGHLIKGGYWEKET